MKKANLDVSNDFDRPPPNRKVSIDVDEIHYWSYRVDYNREYDPEKFKIFAKQNTRALLKAARQFNIDLANPIETAVLLRILALLLFGPERKKGRPLNSKKWNRLG